MLDSGDGLVWDWDWDCECEEEGEGPVLLLAVGEADVVDAGLGPCVDVAIVGVGTDNSLPRR